MRAETFLSSFAAIFAAATLLGGCTTIPQAELQAYRQTFDQVRKESENVIADYAAARRYKSNLVARSASAGRLDEGAPLDVLLSLQPYNARSASSGTQTDIEVRLRAWEVAARYNDALLALAKGQAQELEATSNALLESLKRFPIREVAQAATEATPYASAIVPILQLIQKEVEARRFRQAVILAGPPMQKFRSALRDDANVYYLYRKTILNDRFTFEEQSSVAEAAKEFRDTLSSLKWPLNRDVADVVKRANDERMLAGGVATFPEIRFTPTDGAPSPAASDPAFLALTAIADRIQVRARGARAVAEELRAYHEMMEAYRMLLHTFEDSFTQLREAVEANSRGLPSIQNLESVLSNARLAYTIYTKSQSN